MRFVPPVYHPLINFETGEVDVKQAFPSWRFDNMYQLYEYLLKVANIHVQCNIACILRRTVNHLWQVLMFAKRLFYRIESSNAVNQEAAEL